MGERSGSRAIGTDWVEGSWVRNSSSSVVKVKKVRTLETCSHDTALPEPDSVVQVGRCSGTLHVTRLPRLHRGLRAMTRNITTILPPELLEYICELVDLPSGPLDSRFTLDPRKLQTGPGVPTEPSRRDIPSLYSLMSVCKTLHHPARKVMVKSVELGFRSLTTFAGGLDTQELAGQLLDITSLSFTSYVDEELAACSLLAQLRHIKELAISFCYSASDDAASKNFRNIFRVGDGSKLLRALDNLQALEVLHLEFSHIHLGHEDVFYTALRDLVLPNLTSLRLDYLTHADIALCHLDNFPSLSSLAVCGTNDALDFLESPPGTLSTLALFALPHSTSSISELLPASLAAQLVTLFVDREHAYVGHVELGDLTACVSMRDLDLGRLPFLFLNLELLPSSLERLAVTINIDTILLGFSRRVLPKLRVLIINNEWKVGQLNEGLVAASESMGIKLQVKIGEEEDDEEESRSTM